MNKELTVYITTCDANMFVLKYFQYFFNKYWGKHMKVKILGFNKPDFELAENFEFVSLGTEQMGGAQGWSNYLIDYFDSVDDEYFIYGLDDFMIARPVDIESYEACKNLLNSKIGRIDLQCSMQYARSSKQTHLCEKSNDIQFLELNQSGYGACIYRTSAAFSIWNRKWFLKNMKRNWTPWEWETLGSSLAENDGYRVLGVVDRWPLRKLEILSANGWPGYINITGIRYEDVEAMKSLSQSTDRVTSYKQITGSQWGYYDTCGPNWIKIIYGD